MAWKRRGEERLIAEINITPLTDVMLVLLVIFMVTTPLIMTDSFKLKLPRASVADAEPGKGVVVSVSPLGIVAVNGSIVPREGLYERLKVEMASRQDKTVVIRADGGALHSTVVGVLDTAKQAGAERLSIAAERGERKRP